MAQRVWAPSKMYQIATTVIDIGRDHANLPRTSVKLDTINEKSQKIVEKWFGIEGLRCRV
ncbi:hypothetical protein T484DRAFT_3305133 [Baffinella frigidus]|nr:hypothetical protein T484DRAFT_3305133 [Cryptophyta sp. CCMP2293]